MARGVLCVAVGILGVASMTPAAAESTLRPAPARPREPAPRPAPTPDDDLFAAPGPACVAPQRALERQLQGSGTGWIALSADRERAAREQVAALAAALTQPSPAPTRADCRFTLGLTQWRLGDEAALPSLAAALADGRGDSPVVALHAYLRARRGDVLPALETHQRLLARGHAERGLLRHGADLHLALGHLPEAQALYERACYQDRNVVGERDEAARACLGLGLALWRDSRDGSAARPVRRADGLTNLDQLLRDGDFLPPADRHAAAALRARVQGDGQRCAERAALRRYLDAASAPPVPALPLAIRAAEERLTLLIALPDRCTDALSSETADAPP